MSKDEVLVLARDLLRQRNPLEALILLNPVLQDDPEDLETLQTVAEAHLEASGMPDITDGQQHTENAYKLFTHAAALDSGKTAKAGYDKYLWLGQLSGGQDAVMWFRKGCEGLRQDLSKEDIPDIERAGLRKKLCDALCASIEIWMTDLCMEPEAESMCEALITESLMIDENHPESYSTLASIRLSQEREGEARIAVQRAWELQKELGESTVSEDAAVEVARIDALKSVIKLSLETDLYEIAEEASRQAIALDEEIPEVWYLYALAAVQQYARNQDSTETLASAYDRFSTAYELLWSPTSLSNNAEDEQELQLEVREKMQEIEAVLNNKGTNLQSSGNTVDVEDEWLDIDDDEE
ncbi:uncharacterized protein V1516DRAFT_696132 [Lipomyces oligophaga]|uniref:uncharacterized protein n=1 Tax=Lipomyces oligophaga TaxID=45792 RepID=UPI0034CE88DA